MDKLGKFVSLRFSTTSGLKQVDYTLILAVVMLRRSDYFPGTDTFFSYAVHIQLLTLTVEFDIVLVCCSNCRMVYIGFHMQYYNDIFTSVLARTTFFGISLQSSQETLFLICMKKVAYRGTSSVFLGCSDLPVLVLSRVPERVD